VEHYSLFKDIAARDGLVLSDEKLSLLAQYAGMIFSESRKFNLTGFKTIEEIISGLIIGSLQPFKSANVPRGTIYCDLGSGSGIPGIPFGVMFDYISGFLVESNLKKISFMDEVFSRLKIKNINFICTRAEEFSRIPENKKQYSLVISRAFAPEYTVIEIGAPLLSDGGTMFLYSNKGIPGLPDAVLEHAGEVGLSPGNNFNIDLSKGGISFVKTGITPEKYPRRYPVIKREAERIIYE
jgi:16S rRNA (guanine527-N7)-methyltransferase